MHLDSVPPWSKKQLKRLGKAIREGREHEMTDPRYDDFVIWYDELQTAAQVLLRELDFSDILSERVLDVTGRPKTIDTLRTKLIANPTWALPTIFDVAGVRLEASMNLLEQDRVARRITDELGFTYEDVFSDTRAKPHSGYRGLHLRLDPPAGQIEVQIRTAWQGSWANLYEGLADFSGRGIRYGVMPDDPILHWHALLTQVISMQGALTELFRTAVEASESEWAESRERLIADHGLICTEARRLVGEIALLGAYPEVVRGLKQGETWDETITEMDSYYARHTGPASFSPTREELSSKLSELRDDLAAGEQENIARIRAVRDLYETLRLVR